MNDQRQSHPAEPAGDAEGSRKPSEREAISSEDDAVEEADKTKKLAEIAGGGSNKGSWAGSNESIDQAKRRSAGSKD